MATHHLTRATAAAECLALDLVEMAKGLENARIALVHFDAALTIAALDEVERLEVAMVIKP